MNQPLGLFGHFTPQARDLFEMPARLRIPASVRLSLGRLGFAMTNVGGDSAGIGHHSVAVAACRRSELIRTGAEVPEGTVSLFVGLMEYGPRLPDVKRQAQP
jgi:hypothetical protein